jgi:PPM family protein phosphatase
MLLGEENSLTGSGKLNESEDRSIPAAITDTGCERELNEDRYAVIESPSGVTWLVCDGMGGQTGGELAAQLAIEAIRRDLEKYQARPIEVALKSALFEANRVVVLRRQNAAFSSMGTTVVSAMFDGPEVVIGNIGDSRAYLVREGAIQQLTTDHTLVQQMVEKGEIQPEDALSHPQAHILTRCVGAEPGLDVDLKRFWIWEVSEGEANDSLVLCSDGLYSLISDAEVAKLVTANSPQDACVKLVELAKARGGYDNITVAIIPLSGQLKHAPPPGYADRARKRAKTSTRSSAGTTAERPRIVHNAIFLFALSVVAALITVIGFVLLKFFAGVNL